MTHDGEDKSQRKAMFRAVRVMEVVQRYTVDFHEILKALILPPSRY
jgi:cysteinyl-tRNA synthetase